MWLYMYHTSTIHVDQSMHYKYVHVQYVSTCASHNVISNYNYKSSN